MQLGQLLMAFTELPVEANGNLQAGKKAGYVAFQLENAAILVASSTTGCAKLASEVSSPDHVSMGGARLLALRIITGATSSQLRLGSVSSCAVNMNVKAVCQGPQVAY